MERCSSFLTCILIRTDSTGNKKTYLLRVVNLLPADVQVAQLPHYINSDSLNIFFPARWKTTRSQLTPAFSMGKIKPYFPLIAEVCEELKSCIEKSGKLRDRRTFGEMEVALLREHFLFLTYIYIYIYIYIL